MAKCDLSIELIDPDRIYATGESVRGVVRVRADADVTCKSLAVQTVWQTHGQGNVDSGDGPQISLYQGEWQAGRHYSYDFQLAPAPGPSTYHGHYLNVDHYVKARVDIPWAFDSKAEAVFRVHHDQPLSEEAVSGDSTSSAGFSGWIGLAILVGLGACFLLNPLFLMVAALAGSAGGIWWFFRKYLPARALGETSWRFDRTQFAPGDAVCGELTVAPPRDLAIDQVTWSIKATEECTSGSGSNRTTHKQVIHESTDQLAPEGLIPGGRATRYPIAAALPDEPIYSLDLGANELNWSGELRVHIPRWPDWVRKIDFKVVPAGQRTSSEPAMSADAVAPDLAPAPPVAPLVAPAPAAPPPTPPAPVTPAITFEETARMIWQVRDERDQLERVMAAVRDVPLEVAARIDGRDLFAGRDEYAYRGGDSYRAELVDPATPLVLYIPHALDDQFGRLRDAEWRGQGVIVGYCDRRNRVLVRVVP